MKHVIYDPLVDAAGIGDANVLEYAENFILSNQEAILTSSSLFVDAIRMFIAEGRIDCTEVVFQYYHRVSNEVTECTVNRFGRPNDSEFFKLFLTPQTEILRRLIKAATKTRSDEMKAETNQ